MYLSEIEIENYKCFNRPTKIRLEKGINVITGQNNVGKTSLLKLSACRSKKILIRVSMFGTYLPDLETSISGWQSSLRSPKMN